MKLVSFLNRTIPRWISRLVLLVAVLLVIFCVVRYVLPVYRVRYHSELVMLGDYNGDHRWDKKDRELFFAVRSNPFQHSALDGVKADVNGNGTLDPEDLTILESLFTFEDPYTAEAKAMLAGQPFPRPRELYRYLSPQDYLNRPLYSLPYAGASNSPLHCLSKSLAPLQTSAYARQLSTEIYDEAVRCDLAYRIRLPGLTAVELDYAQKKIAVCNRLFAEGRDYELLIELIGLAEDVETLTTKGQDPFVARTLFFRNHLRELLLSSKYAEFRAGRVTHQEILKAVEGLLKQDLGLTVALDKLGPPREVAKVENYLDRTQWQYYKSRTKTVHFEQLIRFAQHDRRYLRAVARTSRRHTDPGVENHNLPMVLLFREALRITGDKKAAVGLLDESIRIPLYWVKSIPRERLPSSLALENFLLPGNKEDGADKSRHWNVFGGICLYKSPAETLDLALKREMQDLREQSFSVDGMTEFIRDTIANLNGIFYVVSMNPPPLAASKPIKQP